MNVNNRGSTSVCKLYFTLLRSTDSIYVSVKGKQQIWRQESGMCNLGQSRQHVIVLIFFYFNMDLRWSIFFPRLYCCFTICLKDRFISISIITQFKYSTCLQRFRDVKVLSFLSFWDRSKFPRKLYPVYCMVWIYGNM